VYQRVMILDRTSKAAAGGKSHHLLPESSRTFAIARHQHTEVGAAHRHVVTAVRERISYRFSKRCHRIHPFVSVFTFVKYFHFPRFASSACHCKNFLALLLLSPMAALAGEPYTVPSSALTDAARQNLVGGFTYRLPTGWSQKTFPGAQFKTAFGREEDGNPANITFQLAAFSGSLGEFQATILKEMPSVFSKMGISNSRVVNQSAFETSSKLVGLQAVVEVERLDGKTVRELLYFFERKDGQKILVTCSAADEGTRYDAIFDSIVNTFDVTK
jgi:hypothetical protein